MDKSYLTSEATCRFGDFKPTPAVLINDTTIQCMTPETKTSPHEIGAIKARVLFAANGIDYADTGEIFTFQGTGSGTVNQLGTESLHEHKKGVSWLWVPLLLIIVILLVLLLLWLNRKRREGDLETVSILRVGDRDLMHRSKV